jgi:protein-disulfide isomerase
MKPTMFLAGAMAIIAIAGCNSKQGDAATNAPAKIVQVKPPKNGDWTTIVAATPDGGFMMGNPNAKVRLVEYGSLTCPHCREFDENGVPLLLSNYVKSGQVSWEFRNYVREWLDLTATLIARCNGAQSFFPLARALYKDQPTWEGKVQTAPSDQLNALQNLPPSQQFLQAAKLAGLQDWAAARGVPQAKSTQCLTDESKINQLVQWTGNVTNQYPDFQGTPTFIINGKMTAMTTGTSAWDQLKVALDKSLGR